MYSRYFVLFALIITGYVLKKIKFVDDVMYKWLNRFIIYFAYPCMIVHNIGTIEMSWSLFGQFILALAMSCAFFAIYAGISYFYTKLRHFPPSESNIAEFAMSSPNNGFMGFPVALLFFGEKGLFFMLAHNVALNLYFFTYGQVLMNRNKPSKVKRNFRILIKELFKVILNPNIIAVIVGLGVCMLGLPLEGSAVDEYLTYVGGVSTPMSMIFIGSTLAGRSAVKIIKNKVVRESSIVKLFLLPVLTALMVYWLPVDILIKEIMILGSAFPAATTVAMLAEQDNQNSALASEILFLSTIVSIGTIPLMLTLLNTIF